MDILEDCRDIPQKTFMPDQVLIEEGQPLDRLYLLYSGEVSVMKSGMEVARVAEPGAIFGEIAALLGIEATAQVRAVTPVKVAEIEGAGTYIADHPRLALHAAKVLARRLVEATTYLTDVRRQYEGHADHFGMVDQVLETLLQQQERWPSVKPSEQREDDPRL